MSSIFTKILKGEIPCHKIYEDELTFAFLDINPIHPGHTLVIPKIEIDYFLDVPEPHYSAVFQTAKKVGLAIQKATDCKRVGTIILGWDVPHFHYHLVPMWGHGDLNFSKAKRADNATLSEIQKKILQNLV